MLIFLWTPIDKRMTVMRQTDNVWIMPLMHETILRSFYHDSGWVQIYGRGHTNYDIQIMVVILKVTTRFFQQRPWLIGKIIMIVLGSHMPIMNYKVYYSSASVELTQ